VTEASLCASWIADTGVVRGCEYSDDDAWRTKHAISERWIWHQASAITSQWRQCQKSTTGSAFVQHFIDIHMSSTKYVHNTNQFRLRHTRNYTSSYSSSSSFICKKKYNDSKLVCVQDQQGSKSTYGDPKNQQKTKVCLDIRKVQTYSKIIIWVSQIK